MPILPRLTIGEMEDSIWTPISHECLVSQNTLSHEYITAIPSNTTYALNGTSERRIYRSFVHLPENTLWSNDVLIRTFNSALPIISVNRLRSGLEDSPSEYVVNDNNHLYLYKNGLIYRIHSLSCRDRFSGRAVSLLQRYNLCASEEIPTQLDHYLYNLNDVCVFGDIHEYTDNYQTYDLNEAENTVSGLRTTISDRICGTLDNEENIKYEPTEQEINYPELYIRNHKFNCKSKEPMVVGEWANNFNIIISKKLAKLGF